MANRRKAGRKRKYGPRTPAGQRSRSYQTIARDFGTLELQAHRRALVAESADPDLSATALGVLLSYGHIDREQYEIALRYAALRMTEFGTPWPRNGGSGREITDEEQCRLKRALDRLRARLDPAQRDAVDRIAHLPPPNPLTPMEWQPTWFQMLRIGKALTAADEVERHALLSGLDAMLDRNRINATAA